MVSTASIVTLSPPDPVSVTTMPLPRDFDICASASASA
jgi:hypothetical protein